MSGRVVADSLESLLGTPWVVRLAGAFAGVLLSMALIPPDNTRNAFYRVVLGTMAGFIFAPTVQRIVPFLSGERLDDWLAASTATSFVAWFVLETIARWISTPDTGRKLIQYIEKRMGVTEGEDREK